ncbi:MAG: DnaJ domain-containing protein [Patescibacteria group bacterium]
MTPHEVLEVEPSASIDEIKKAYKKLAKKHHPDKGGDPKKFKEVNEAYNAILADMEKSLMPSGSEKNMLKFAHKHPKLYGLPEDRVVPMPDHRLKDALALLAEAVGRRWGLFLSAESVVLLLGFLLTSRFPDKVLGVPGVVWQAFFMLYFFFRVLSVLYVFGRAIWEKITGQPVKLFLTKEKIVEDFYSEEMRESQ